MNSFLDFLRRWVPLLLIFLLVGANVFVAACGGLAKYIPMKLDPKVQAMTGCTDDSVPLSEAPYIFDLLELETKYALLNQQDNLADSLFIFDFISSVAGQLKPLAAGAATSAGFPIISSLLIGGLCLATDSPGSKRRRKRAQDVGYRQGHTDGRNGNGDGTPPPA